MFDIGFPEFAVLAVLALFVIGPDRLPGAAAQAGRMLRELRAMATGARRELSEHLDLDPELASLDLKSLDPRQMVRGALLDDDIVDEVRSNGSAAAPAVRPAKRKIAEGERPPYDPDAT